eukprot:8941990-Alexandrium_andersonii.AAC.1
MSASLVGSEMCIRDRKQAGGRAGGAFRRAQRGPGAVDPPGKPQPLEYSCLLYTSDAADDM